MNAQSLASMWLRDRAEGLRVDADRHENAYTKDPLRSACRYVAAHYREAAVILDEAAVALEDDVSVMTEAKR